MSSQTSFNRRSVITACAAAAIPAEVVARHPAKEDVMHAQQLTDRQAPCDIPQEWHDCIRTWSRLHPNGAHTARRAYEKGLNLNDLEAVTFNGVRLASGSYPVAHFRTPTGYLVVHPESVWEYRREPRAGEAH